MNLFELNIRHLKAFQQVARLKGISAAAGQVHLSQPAVTQAIAGLEARLDLPLFDRRIDGMFATDAGRMFQARIERMFGHLEHATQGAPRRAGARNGAPSGFHTKLTASQLRALVAIWETGSFSMAARRLNITQPSIHRAARDLEAHAGTRFFNTSHRGVDLTKAGERFARAVKLAASELQQGLDEIAALKGRDVSHITLGSMPLSRSAILPEAIHQFLAETESVQVRTVDGPYPRLLRGLRYGDLDVLIGALRDPLPADDVVQEPLFDDPLAVIAGPGHPLAGRPGLTLADTLAYPWVAPPRTAPAGAYLYDTLGIGAMQSTPVRIVSSSLVLVRGLLMRGNYVTIMSLHQMALERDLGLLVPLDIDLPDSARPIGLTYRADWQPTKTQARFLELLRRATS